MSLDPDPSKQAQEVIFSVEIEKLIALNKLLKMFFISSKKLFSFSGYSDFFISLFPSFYPCQPLLEKMIEGKSLNLWRHQLAKQKSKNIMFDISRRKGLILKHGQLI